MTNFLKEAHLCISAIEINYSPILPQSLQAQSRQPNFNLNPRFLLEPLKKKKKSEFPLPFRTEKNQSVPKNPHW